MNKIAYWRREMGLTQEEFSYATGIARSRVSLMERQFTDPTSEELKTISKLLKVSVDRLVRAKPDDLNEMSGGQSEC